MKKLISLILSLLLTVSLAACKGEALPEGMSEEALYEAGKTAALLLVEGEYDALYQLLREDQRAAFTVEDIRAVVEPHLSDAGVYKQIEDHMTTGQTIEGVRYGVAVLYCEFAEGDLLVRLSFDKDLQLVGFALDRQ